MYGACGPLPWSAGTWTTLSATRWDICVCQKVLESVADENPSSSLKATSFESKTEIDGCRGLVFQPIVCGQLWFTGVLGVWYPPRIKRKWPWLSKMLAILIMLKCSKLFAEHPFQLCPQIWRKIHLERLRIWLEQFRIYSGPLRIPSKRLRIHVRRVSIPSGRCLALSAQHRFCSKRHTIHSKTQDLLKTTQDSVRKTQDLVKETQDSQTWFSQVDWGFKQKDSDFGRTDSWLNQ